MVAPALAPAPARAPVVAPAQRPSAAPSSLVVSTPLTAKEVVPTAAVVARAGTPAVEEVVARTWEVRSHIE